jgi:NADH dehydrogenase
VIEVGERGVTVKRANNVEVIPTRTVIWAAGVRGSAIARVLEERTGATLDRGGRIPVTDHLTIAGFPEIYVVGDVAAAKQRNGELVPGVAPAAMQMGRYAAKEILRKVKGQPSKPFHYINKGNLAVIGRHSAVAEIAKLRFAGPLAWFIWLFIHLMYIVTFENRLIIFLRWGVSYLTWNRMARLITGRPTTGTEECEPITVEQRQAEAIK